MQGAACAAPSQTPTKGSAMTDILANIARAASLKEDAARRAARTAAFREEWRKLRRNRRAMDTMGVPPRIVSGSGLGLVLADAIVRGEGSTHA